MSYRISYFDNVKFILILLVIFGHVLPLNYYYPVERGIYNFIFLFHMPLFIFISGYFTKIDNRDKLIKSIIRLIETLLCFQLIHLFLGYSLEHRISLNFLYVPEYTLWYLLCIIYWRFVLYIVKPSMHSYKSLWIVFGLSILAGFIPLSVEMSFQRAFFFFPFFITGYYVKEKNVFGKLHKLPYNICLIIFFFLFLLSIVSAVISVPSFIYDKHLFYGVRPYYAFKYPLWLTLGLRVLYMFLAFFLSILFLRLVPQKKLLVTQYGKDTLFFYV